MNDDADDPPPSVGDIVYTEGPGYDRTYRRARVVANDGGCYGRMRLLLLKGPDFGVEIVRRSLWMTEEAYAKLCLTQ